MRRTEGRRRLRFLLVASAVGLLVTTAVVATRTALLDVERIVVVGATETDPSAVLARVGIASGDQLVDLDLGAARERLASLPWVAEATVEWEWNGTVAVGVRERRALATVAGPGGAWAVVDERGRVLELQPDAPADLVRLEGIDPAGAPGAQLSDAASGALQVAAALPSSLSESVSTVSVQIATAGGADADAEADVDVELVLADGAVIRLGPVVGLADKLLAAATVLEQLSGGAGPGRTCTAVLDVRVPAAPALTPRTGCA